MAYYLKYRSKKISELDLEAVRESLSNVVSSGNIPHAFLFSGPKGTGKTSAARILAKVINCEKRTGKSIEPCNRCEQCKLIDNGSNIDVVEMDAASNRGIDDIRALRDAVKLSPANAKCKVYVIDEAHMLTTEASNALLKTLEEPPDHVYFILATTNPEKLIGTIRSRTTQIYFRKANIKELMRSLKRVVKGEKINTDDSALALIAYASGGSFRDAHKLLEQVQFGRKKLTEKRVLEMLDTAGTSELEEFIQLLQKRDIKNLIKFVENAAEKGTEMKGFILEVMDVIKKQLLSSYGVVEVTEKYFAKDELIVLIELFDSAYQATGTTAIEQIPLELAVIDWCEEGGEKNDGGGGEVKEKSSNKNKVKVSKKVLSTQKVESGNGKNGHDKKLLTNGIRKRISNGREIDNDSWKQVLSSIRLKNTSTEALLRAAKPLCLNDDTLTVGVFYNFHKEHLEAHNHRTLLEETLCEVMGKDIKIICKLTEPPKKPELVEVEKEVGNGKFTNGEIKVEDHKERSLTPKDDDDIVKIAEEIFG